MIHAHMTTTDTLLCLSCGKPTAHQLACPGCGIVQSRDGAPDFFALFGLPRTLALDLDDLTERYYTLSRRLHPDLFHDRSAAERAASLDATALVNRAYYTLRDPVRRGLYWLTLHGESLGRDNETVPPELATLVFDVQEKLEELRATRGTQDGTALESEMRTIQGDLRAKLRDYEERLCAHFAVSDRSGGDVASGGAGHSREAVMGALAETKRILSELHYLRTLARDVERELEPRWNA